MKRRIIMLLVVLACVSIGQASLVCHYKFDGNLTDSSANNYPAGDGALVGDTQYVAGKYGQALDFDGVQDFVQIMVAPNGTGGWIPIYRAEFQEKVSFAMWVKMDAYPADVADIFVSREWLAGNTNIEFHPFGFGLDTPFFLVAHGTFLTEYPHKTIAPEKLGNWFHLAVTYDANVGGEGQACMYIDGVPSDVVPITSGAMVRIGNYTLGGCAMYDARWLDGQVDELYIYDQILTPSDIDDIINDIPVSETHVCGDAGYFAGDINKDCYVNMGDFAQMALEWLKCSNLNLERCEIAD